MDPGTEALIGLGLFVASELIGLSRLKSNSLLQLLLAAAMRSFPYELRKREEPKRSLFRR
jgi:hypothetical protein